jgi:uracil-DNA glycosylase family 4
MEAACDRICKECPCAVQAAVFRPLERSEVAFVFDNPSESEVRHDQWLRGKRGGTGDLLKAILRSLRQDPDDVYMCSAVNCRPNQRKTVLQKKAMHTCRNRLIEELQEAGVEKVLSFGSIGYSALLDSRNLLPVTGIRGRWRELDNGMKVMSTLPVSFVFRDPDWFRDVVADIDKFFLTDGPEPNPDVNLWVPTTIGEALEALEYVNSMAWVSCDFETTGLSPHGDFPIALGFGWEDEEGVSVVILDDVLLECREIWNMIGKLLSNPDLEIAFHNAIFDLQFFRHSLEHFGFEYNPQSIHCTLMMHYAIDERPISAKYRSHKLETLARVRYDSPDYSINMRQFLAKWKSANEYEKRALRAELHIYLGLDCYYTLRLFTDLERECNEEGMLDLYDRILMPASLAISEIEYKGIKIDKPFFQEARAMLAQRIEKLLRRIRKTVGKSDFNPGSPQQVREYIYTDCRMPFGMTVGADGTIYHTARRGGMREGPTAAVVLKALARRHPEIKEVVDDIVEYRNLTKNKGTYVDGILSRLDIDNRLHTSLNLAGTATGRLSSSNPNLQNIPDASHTGVEIRGGFIPEDDCVLLNADYKQLEVRVAAWLADDDAMRAIFSEGGDPHGDISETIFQQPVSEMSTFQRVLAKKIVFGMMYGQGADSIANSPDQEAMMELGGQRLTPDIVNGMFENLLNKWRGYARWREHQKHIGYTEGEICMLTGRRRRFGFIPRHDAGYVGRASFNNPVQSTASDFTLWALIQLHALLPEGAHIVLTVHDSIVIECRRDLVAQVVPLVREVMEHKTLFDIDVPLVVDLEVVERWGSKESIDIADVDSTTAEMAEALS